MEIDLSRRKFFQLAGIGAGLTVAHPFLPMRMAFADTLENKKLMVVILRGAMDGLAAVVPYGDKGYAKARGAMALPQNDETLINLDGFFAMHSALKPLAELYKKKELLVYHASATPYRKRSHFDAQDLLENGTDKPHGISSGWLNRSISSLSKPLDAIAIGSSVPLALQGNANVGSWAPSVLPSVDDDFMSRVENMYKSDPLLLNAFVNAQEMKDMGGNMQGAKRGSKAFVGMMKKAAGFMADDDGANIATVEIGGWDTHANQGLQKGRLANNFKILAEGITAFKQDMGEAWKDTAVVTITEFGRTVKGNGTGGTDHGTASVAFLAGGSVNGGKVIGDWPGLNKLYDGRDLLPVNDLRALLKSLLQQQLSISKQDLDKAIFPNSRHVWLKDKLFV